MPTTHPGNPSHMAPISPSFSPSLPIALCSYKDGAPPCVIDARVPVQIRDRALRVPLRDKIIARASLGLLCDEKPNLDASVPDMSRKIIHSKNKTYPDMGLVTVK